MAGPAPSDPSATPRIGFAGTPEFAARILAALIGARHRPVVVYSQPDRPTGRGRRHLPSPVKLLAQQEKLPLRQPATLRSAAEAAALAAAGLDVLVVAAYGLILPEPILTTPRLGCLNVHASLLPRWRGAAPIERAIMAGDRRTGACIMRMETGLDTGPVYLRREVPIEDDTDGAALAQTLADLGSAALLDCLGALESLEPVAQPAEGVTYAHKLTRADAAIDWSAPADAIERQVRALRVRMPAFSEAPGGRFTVLEAAVAPTGLAARPGTVLAADADGIVIACGAAALTVRRLHLAGRPKPVSAAEALRGGAARFAPGTILGGTP